MKLYKTDLLVIAKHLDELERSGLDIESFRHRDLIIHVAHESSQKDGNMYWITNISDPKGGTL